MSPEVSYSKPNTNHPSFSGSSLISTIALPITDESQTLQSFKYEMDGPGPNPGRQEAPHPHMAALDPSGGFIIVPDLGADILRVYSVDKPTGFLTSCANVTATPGSGPRHVAFWEGADSTMMYLANELSNDVSVYSVAYPTVDGECLGLVSIQTEKTYPEDQEVKDGQKIGEVRVSVS